MFHLADSGFGNILYIIFGILYFLYQAYSAGKKKNKKPSPQTEYETDSDMDYDKEPQEKPGSFESIFDKMREIERNFRKQETIESQKETPFKEERVKYKSIKRKTPITLIPTDLDEESESNVEATDTNERNMAFRNIDLKEAVIAAEILKRPEW